MTFDLPENYIRIGEGKDRKTEVQRGESSRPTAGHQPLLTQTEEYGRFKPVPECENSLVESSLGNKTRARFQPLAVVIGKR